MKVQSREDVEAIWNANSQVKRLSTALLKALQRGDNPLALQILIEKQSIIRDIQKKYDVYM